MYIWVDQVDTPRFHQHFNEYFSVTFAGNDSVLAKRLGEKPRQITNSLTSVYIYGS